MVEQTSFRFPDGTAARIKALARPGETLASVLLRGLSALETDDTLQKTLSLAQRIEALEAAVFVPQAPAAEPAQVPQTIPRKLAPGPHGYPVEVRAMAVEMRQAGRSYPEIREAIMQACGRAPHPHNLGRELKRWEGA